MDPITAGFLAVKAWCEMVTVIVQGQPEASREKAWERWDKFLDILGSIGKLPKPAPPPTP